MKILIALIAITLLTGCTSTKSIVRLYDAQGRLIKRTETSLSVISTVVSSTKDKTLILWEDSFSAYISASAGTTEDPTPHGKLFVGKTNKGVISIHKDHKDITGISLVIQSTKSSSLVSTKGITNTNKPPQLTK